MKVLLVGGGGREHALAWSLHRSPHLNELHCAPGNAGIARQARCLDLAAEDVDAIVAHVDREGYDLVVVGPEAPLVGGLADRLEALGTPVFGPRAAAAEIEGSKIFAKLFMSRHGIPTGGFQLFSDLGECRDYLGDASTTFPLVVKADGLAAGKGVIIAEDRAAALAVSEGMLSGRSFGDAGRRVLIEELLRGREASFFVLTDGERFVELATCQDYKRALDDDRGPNTGGMGTYSPSAYLGPATRQTILETIVRPTIRGLAAEGRTYRGVLYFGLMLTDGGPQVLEYNARFGDPETQVLLPRLEGDWLELLHGCATGRIDDRPLSWRRDAAVCVVLASGGYPGAYSRGLPIEGIETVEALDDVIVFHAGTRLDDDGRLVTSGGRVLGVTALGPDLAAARERAYAAVARIRWEGAHFREDIALAALERSRA